MPKRHSDKRHAVGRKANRRRHRLYLVMNDGEEVYAIRKIDLSLDSDTDDDAQQPHRQRAIEKRLPPALIRFKASASRFFVSIGTKIMVTDSFSCRRVVPVFDVCKRLLYHGPRPRLRPCEPIYMPVGNKLVSLDNGCSELLHPPPEHQYVDWEWCKLPKHPFKREGVTSHAAHPDGRRIFVSSDGATFTLDTESKKWKYYCNSMLPFTGCAHFDEVLGAWVGLSSDPDMLGYLCSCGIPPTDAEASNAKSLHWKLSNEKLFCKDPAENHFGASLVYMGDRRKFCLVQYFSIEDDNCDHKRSTLYKKLKTHLNFGYVDPDILDDLASDVEEELLGPPRRCLLRLTTFSLDYDKDGGLQIGSHRQVRCYKLPRAATILDDALQHPVVFWM